MNKHLLIVLFKCLLFAPIMATEFPDQTQPHRPQTFTQSFIEAHPNPQLEWDIQAQQALKKEIKSQRKNDKAKRITLYHTQCWDGILLEELHRLLASENRHHYLRSPQPLPEGVHDATTFIERPGFSEGKGYNDTKTQNRPHILCVSLSLQDGSGMESAAGFFKKYTGALGSNCDVNKAITFDSVVDDIIDSYASESEKLHTLAPQIKEKFLEIAHNVMEQESDCLYPNMVGQSEFFKYKMHRLYTFSIPLEHLNTVFYLSLPFGTYNISGDMIGTYNAMRADYASGKNYIEQNISSFTKSPAQIYSNLFWGLFEKNPQGRLLITHPLLQNPNVLNYTFEEFYNQDGRVLYERFLKEMANIKAFIDASNEGL